MTSEEKYYLSDIYKEELGSVSIQTVHEGFLTYLPSRNNMRYLYKFQKSYFPHWKIPHKMLKGYQNMNTGLEKVI